MVSGFSFAPFASFLFANRDESLTVGSALPYALLVAGLCLGLIAVVWALRSSLAADRFAVVLASALFIFFNYPAVSGPLAQMGLRIRYQLLAWVGVLLAVGAIAAWAARRPPVRQWAMVFAVLLAITPLLQLTWYRLSNPGESVVDAEPQLVGLERTPDIYYVVPDAYTNARLLESEFGFDNTAFVTGLEREGFVVADDAHSNYAATYLSVPSVLQMDYVVADGDSLPVQEGSENIDRSDLYDILRGESMLMEILSSANYVHIQAPEGTWSGSACSGQEDVCIDPLILADAPQLQLGDLQWALLELTPVATVLEAGLGETFDGVASDPAHVAREVGQLGLDAPVFVFIHMMHAHPPFRFDAKCGPIDQIGERDLTRWDLEARGAYVAGIKCANRRLEAMLELLPREAVVVIQGDHGPSFLSGAATPLEDLTDEQIEERLSVLSALRLPEDCDDLAGEGVAGVNTFRVVLACLSGEEPELLEEHYFMGGYQSSGLLEVELPR